MIYLNSLKMKHIYNIFMNDQEAMGCLEILKLMILILF
ncbi:hypothetical protein HMPREF1145_1307 [Oribacterium parvum ACB8]|nr:hypothetical protein HMPREF1145_1307 [Oribacterium parvum ACB8]